MKAASESELEAWVQSLMLDLKVAVGVSISTAATTAVSSAAATLKGGSADDSSATSAEVTQTLPSKSSTPTPRLTASERSAIDQLVITALIADAIRTEDFEVCVQYKKYKALLLAIDQAVVKENFEECVKLRQEKVQIETAHPAIGAKRDEVTKNRATTLSQERKHSGPSLTATPPPVLPDADVKKPNIADAVSKAQALWAKAGIKPIPPRNKAANGASPVTMGTFGAKKSALDDDDDDSSPDLDFDAEGSDDVVRKKKVRKPIPRMGTWTGGHTLSSFYKMAGEQDDDTTEELVGEKAPKSSSAAKKAKKKQQVAGLSVAEDVKPKKKKKVKKKKGDISIAADLEQAKKDLSELKLTESKPKKKKKKVVS
jgi:hypothetical protein